MREKEKNYIITKYSKQTKIKKKKRSPFSKGIIFLFFFTFLNKINFAPSNAETRKRARNPFIRGNNGSFEESSTFNLFAIRER